jgi:glycerophosphoryl diester phosphodiesterase
VLLLLVIFGCSSNSSSQPPESNQAMAEQFDWQGHRGARGLLPENTVPAFLEALKYPVTTLELDVVISKDSQVVVSHEPWMSHHICSNPDGSAVAESQEDSLLLFQMTYEQIQQYDCGSRGNEGFPGQEPMPAVKPTLRAVVEAVRVYCEENNRELPNYNVEIKSRPEWDGVKTPAPETFVRLVLSEIEALGIQERTCIQSFDKRSLRAVREQQPGITTALLIDNANGVEHNVEDLGYVPKIYSPHYRMVAANVVDTVHERGMRIIPWTVNEVEEMSTLIEMGVDGIITDYPDRIEGTLQKF